MQLNQSNLFSLEFESFIIHRACLIHATIAHLWKLRRSSTLEASSTSVELEPAAPSTHSSMISRVQIGMALEIDTLSTSLILTTFLWLEVRDHHHGQFRGCHSKSVESWCWIFSSWTHFLLPIDRWGISWPGWSALARSAVDRIAVGRDSPAERTLEKSRSNRHITITQIQ